MKRSRTESFLPVTKDQAQHPLFKGIIVHCLKDIPERDCQVIYAGTEVYGGEYRYTLDDMVTHIVTLGEVEGFIQDLDEWTKKGLKVVLPEWFDDCFQLALLCPDDQYIFPNPKVLTLELADLLSSKVFPPVKEIKLAANISLFSDKVFYLEQSQEDQATRDASQASVNSKLIAAIEKFGGKLGQSLEESTTVIVELEGKLYEEAKSLGKEIGTKRWIRDQIKAQKLSSPLDSVLHYPCPSYQLPEMKNLVITVSNYVGSAREDIFLMVNRLGATTSRSMTTANTHLITACAGGEKYNRAHSWNMHIVNHLWIEEIYAKWTYQREAKPKYVFFPSCIGQMVNKVRVMPRPVFICEKAPELIPTTDVSARKDEEELIDLSEKPISAKNIELMSVEKEEIPEKSAEILKEGFVNQATVPVVNAISSKRKKLSPQRIVEPNEHQEIFALGKLVQKEPEEDLPIMVTENIPPLQEIPALNGEEEIKDRKRTLLKSSSGLGPSKKLKPDSHTQIRVMFTGIRPVEQQKKIMKNLGITIVDSVTDADLLIAHKIARTEKFLLAVTKGIPIISLKWVEELSSRRIIPDPEHFPLIDERTESDHGFRLKDALVKAAKKQIFAGYSVYCIGRVEPDSKTIQRLVEAASGSYKGVLTKKNISIFWKDYAENESSTLCFCSLSDEQIAKDLNMKNVYSTELLLNGLLKQELEWNQYQIFCE